MRTANRHALADAWRLPADGRERLLHMPKRQCEACQDIEHALERLLGDRDQICGWLRRKHPHLFHARPLDIALRSLEGCLQVRRSLLTELAATDSSEGIAAIARESPP